jgi:hypothetical protein
MLPSINRRRLPHRVDYNRMALLCGLLALTVVSGGCRRGPTWNLGAVEGTITKDGHPMHGLYVVYMPDLEAGTQGPRSSGTTDEAGHYRLRTDNDDDGVVVGKHRVLVIDPKALKRRRKQSVGEPQPEEITQREEQRKASGNSPRVPPHYGDFNKTLLRVEVQPGPQIIDFDIKGNSIQIK